MRSARAAGASPQRQMWEQRAGMGSAAASQWTWKAPGRGELRRGAAKKWLRARCHHAPGLQGSFGGNRAILVCRKCLAATGRPRPAKPGSRPGDCAAEGIEAKRAKNEDRLVVPTSPGQAPGRRRKYCRRPVCRASQPMFLLPRRRLSPAQPSPPASCTQAIRRVGPRLSASPLSAARCFRQLLPSAPCARTARAHRSPAPGPPRHRPRWAAGLHRRAPIGKRPRPAAGTGRTPARFRR